MRWPKTRGKPYVCHCGKTKDHKHEALRRWRVDPSPDPPPEGAYVDASGCEHWIVPTGHRKPTWRLFS